MPLILEDVPEFPGYRISAKGRLFSAWKLRRRSGGGRGTESYISDEWKELSVGTPGKGYPNVSLRKEGKCYDWLVHRLVLLTFVGPCPEGKEGCHRDGNPWNNDVRNLYWGTRLENVADAIRHGTFYNATEAAAEVNRGKERSEEVKAKISAAHLGKPLSEEHKENIKANHWSTREDASDIAERSAAKHRGKEHTEEHKGKIGANHWSNREDAEEIAEKMASQIRGRKNTPEQRKRMSDAAKARHARERAAKKVAEQETAIFGDGSTLFD